MSAIPTAFLNALLNGVLVSAPLVAFVWLGLRVASPRILSASARYVVWWVTLAVTIALPAAYLPSHRSSPVVRMTESVATPREVGPLPVAVIHAAPLPSPVAQPRQFPLRVEAGPWIAWISDIWALVTALFLLRLVLSLVLLSRRKKRARIVLEAVPASARRHIRMAISEEVPAPMAAGFLHPTILIPARLMAQLDSTEMYLVGLHEAAHFARRDDYAVIVERFIEALFALHPVVRWIARQLDLEREIACDDRVVAATGRPRPYAACLARVAELTAGVPASFAAAGAAREGSQLTRRVEMLLDNTRRTRTRWLKTRLACALALVTTLAWMAAHTPAALAFTDVTLPRMVLPLPRIASPEIAAPEIATQPSRATRPAAQPLLAQAAPPQPPAPERPTEAATPLPVVFEMVEVTDTEQRVVSGLKQENFRVLEDGVEQNVSYFAADDTPASVGIVSLNPAGLTLAMQEELVRLQQSVPIRVEFIDAANSNLSVDDAAKPAMDRLRQTGHSMRRVVLIFGGETGFPGTLPYALGGVTVVNIAPGVDVEPPAISAFLEGNYYVLGYTPMNRQADGKYRRIQVKMSPPKGLPPLRVSFRTGYYASGNQVVCKGRVLSLVPLPPNATCY